jgi:hypothetical protein
MQKDVTNTEEVTNSLDRPAAQKGELIQFPIKTETYGAPSVSAQQYNTYQLDSMEYEDQIRAKLSKRTHRNDIIRKTLDANSKVRLKEAFYSITDACELDIELVERSNCFDEWKDQIDLFAREAVNISANHRKILGTLISATHHRDVIDFTLEVLKMFQDTTNVLRQPRITNNDVKRVIKNFSRKGVSVTIPLATEKLSENMAESLEKLMSEILKESNSNKE